MAAPLTIGNLICETSVTTGTGNQTLVAVNGKQNFSTKFGTGGTQDVFDYFISNPDAAEWERGTGHMSTSTVLVRDTVIESSNADALVSFAAGQKVITNDLPASFHGGQWNLLQTVVASSDATIAITGLTNAYYMYKFIWNNLSGSLASENLEMRTSSDNGATFDESGYAWVLNEVSMVGGPAHDVAGDDSDSEISVVRAVGTDVAEVVDIELTLLNPSAAEFTKMQWKVVYVDSGAIGYTNFGGGIRLTRARMDAVQFFMTGGDIEVGTLKVYGVRA